MQQTVESELGMIRVSARDRRLWLGELNRRREKLP
jgi:hypothetical protein